MVKPGRPTGDNKELESLTKIKIDLEKNLKEVNAKIAKICFGNTLITIDIENEIFKIIYELAHSGWRELDDFTFRDSEFEYCTYRLFYDRVFPSGAPVPVDQIEISMYKNSISGVVELPGTTGIAAVGTILHLFFQQKLIEKFGPEIIKAEEEISHEFNFNGIIIKILGHIDLKFPFDGYMKLGDFKTMGDDNFKRVIGLLPAGELSYANLKKLSATGQGNAYAVQLGHEGKDYLILWMTQKNLAFKIEDFKTNKKDYTDGLIRIVNIVEKIKRFHAGETSARPKPGGVMDCTYCKHFGIKCLGRESVLGGQKTLDILTDS